MQTTAKRARKERENKRRRKVEPCTHKIKISAPVPVTAATYLYSWISFYPTVTHIDMCTPRKCNPLTKLK